MGFSTYGKRIRPFTYLILKFHMRFHHQQKPSYRIMISVNSLSVNSHWFACPVPMDRANHIHMLLSEREEAPYIHALLYMGFYTPFDSPIFRFWPSDTKLCSNWGHKTWFSNRRSPLGATFISLCRGSSWWLTTSLLSCILVLESLWYPWGS